MMENQTQKLQCKVGGLSCSFCAESVRKAYRRIDAVSDVNVSLAHEEVLIQYDPQRVTEPELKDTLRQLGYTVRDPKKVRTFEEEEAELRREKRRCATEGCRFVSRRFNVAMLFFATGIVSVAIVGILFPSVMMGFLQLFD